MNKNIYITLMALVFAAIPAASIADLVRFDFKARLDNEIFEFVEYYDEEADEEVYLGSQTITSENNPYNLTGGDVEGMADDNFNTLLDGRFHRGVISFDDSELDDEGEAYDYLFISCSIGGVNCSYFAEYAKFSKPGSLDAEVTSFSEFHFDFGPTGGTMLVSGDGRNCSGNFNGNEVYCISDSFYDANFTLKPVPLPAGLPLLLAGMGGFGFIGRYRSKAQAIR